MGIDDCPLLFVAHPELGCSFSTVLRSSAGLVAGPRQWLASTEGGVLVVLSDQPVFVTTAGL